MGRDRACRVRLKCKSCVLQEDARLATFDEFLSEHWDIGIVLGYLQGSNLALQAAVVPCVDYPARASEANAQPFICLRKASFVADAVLGTRNEKAKERFLQVSMVQVWSISLSGSS